MQTTSAAFTAEEKDTVRRIVQNLQVSWKNESTIGNRTFTIGVSLIGGNDVIGINPGAVGSPSNYKYFDESQYVMSLAWERGLNMPTGGLSKAMAEAQLDNTSGRFLPRHMGGNSELFTAIELGKPAIINAGFNYNGIDNSIPQFAGIVTEQPQVGLRNKTMQLKMEDYVHYFQGKKLDTAVIFTGERTDQVMTTLATQLGMSTAQYDFDTGINIIPYGKFDVGIHFSQAFHELAEAENGHIFQDEEGKFRFWNRQHWTESPYTDVQKVISTSMVIDAEMTDASHVINAVEIDSEQYQKQPEQIIYRQDPFDFVEVPANDSISIFVNFDDPVLSLTTPTSSSPTSFFVVTTTSDGSGTDISSDVTVTKVARFAKSAKLTFTNSSSTSGFMVSLVISGRVARSVADIYTYERVGSSITAYQGERLLRINNRFIQSQDWANSYAQMILNDYATTENLQKLTVRGMPDLQFGDLISWQGRYWTIYDIKSMMSADVGSIQELFLVQRDTTTYFRIGISTIGGGDVIAP